MTDFPVPNFMNDHFTTQNKIFKQISEDAHLKNNPVIDVCQAIKDYIIDFERELDNEHEIGIRLASFGGVIIFHADKIGFSKPNVITFYGVTDDGEKVQLIQHVSQLNFLLRAVRKREETAKRIGFSLPGA